MSHDELRHGAKHRLQALRADAAKLAANPHRNMQTAANPTWRTVRYRKMSEKYPQACPGLNGRDSIIWAFAERYLPVRDIRDCGDIIGIRHTGWYTDCEGLDSAVGIVGRLSHGRFVVGYRWTSNDEFVIFTGEVFDDEESAARMSDEHARVFAENAREDDERFNAMQLAEFDVEEKTDELGKAFALRHHAKFGGFDRVRDAIDALRRAREELSDATRTYERG